MVVLALFPCPCPRQERKDDCHDVKSLTMYWDATCERELQLLETLGFDVLALDPMSLLKLVHKRSKRKVHLESKRAAQQRASGVEDVSGVHRLSSIELDNVGDAKCSLSQSPVVSPVSKSSVQPKSGLKRPREDNLRSRHGDKDEKDGHKNKSKSLKPSSHTKIDGAQSSKHSATPKHKETSPAPKEKVDFFDAWFHVLCYGFGRYSPEQWFALTPETSSVCAYVLANILFSRSTLPKITIAAYPTAPPPAGFDFVLKVSVNFVVGW